MVQVSNILSITHVNPLIFINPPTLSSKIWISKFYLIEWEGIGGFKMFKSIVKQFDFPFFKKEFFLENLITTTAMIVFFIVSIGTIFGLVTLYFYIYNL